MKAVDGNYFRGIMKVVTSESIAIRVLQRRDIYVFNEGYVGGVSYKKNVWKKKNSLCFPFFHDFCHNLVYRMYSYIH